MIAINYDAQVTQGKIYEKEELFQLAVTMYLYALSINKVIEIDPETQIVTLK